MCQIPITLASNFLSKLPSFQAALGPGTVVTPGYRCHWCRYPILSNTQLELAPCLTSSSLLDSHLVLRGKLPSSRMKAAGEGLSAL